MQRCLKCCFRLLEEDIDAMGEDQVRSVAILLRWLPRHELQPSTEHTQGHVDLLVDYHLQIYEGTDYEAVDNTFEVLAGLGASPSTQGRMRRYIDTMIRYMEITPAALHAAWIVRSAIASMGQEDESFRERFSKALSSVLMGRYSTVHQAPGDSPNTTCLTLLCLLSQVPAWHPQLHQSGLFDNCLAIADVLLSEEFYLSDGANAVPVAHILAIMEGLDEENSFFRAVQGYPSWPVILRAWRYIFTPGLPQWAVPKKPWEMLPATECIIALPPVVASARRRCGNMEEPAVIGLVEQALQKLVEERQNHEQDGSQEDEIFVSGESDEISTRRYVGYLMPCGEHMCSAIAIFTPLYLFTLNVVRKCCMVQWWEHYDLL